MFKAVTSKTAGPHPLFIKLFVCELKDYSIVQLVAHDSPLDRPIVSHFFWSILRFQAMLLFWCIFITLFCSSLFCFFFWSSRLCACGPDAERETESWNSRQAQEFQVRFASLLCSSCGFWPCEEEVAAEGAQSSALWAHYSGRSRYRGANSSLSVSVTSAGDLCVQSHSSLWRMNNEIVKWKKFCYDIKEQCIINHMLQSWCRTWLLLVCLLHHDHCVLVICLHLEKREKKDSEESLRVTGVTGCQTGMRPNHTAHHTLITFKANRWIWVITHSPQMHKVLPVTLEIAYSEKNPVFDLIFTFSSVFASPSMWTWNMKMFTFV